MLKSETITTYTLIVIKLCETRLFDVSTRLFICVSRRTRVLQEKIWNVRGLSSCEDIFALYLTLTPVIALTFGLFPIRQLSITTVAEKINRALHGHINHNPPTLRYFFYDWPLPTFLSKGDEIQTQTTPRTDIQKKVKKLFCALMGRGGNAPRCVEPIILWHPINLESGAFSGGWRSGS